MVAAGIGGFAVTRALSDGTDGRAGPPIIEPTGPDTGSDDPDAEVLRDLGVQQQDVGSNRSVIIIPDGTDHVDGVTLDLCEGTFPSETLRTARLQVADIDRNSNVALSTEAVLYRDPAALDQAFAELRRTRAACTTEEFLAEAERHGGIAEEQRAALRRFLHACDLVKFAAMVPAEQEHLEALLTASAFVHATVPVAPEPQVAASGAVA